MTPTIRCAWCGGMIGPHWELMSLHATCQPPSAAPPVPRPHVPVHETPVRLLRQLDVRRTIQAVPPELRAAVIEGLNRHQRRTFEKLVSD